MKTDYYQTTPSKKGIFREETETPVVPSHLIRDTSPDGRFPIIVADPDEGKQDYRNMN